MGAKVSRQAKFGPSNDPLEKKLRAKLNTGKRKAAIIAKEYTPSARDGGDNEDDEDLDSRTSAFDKKRARAPMTVCSQANKKHNYFSVSLESLRVLSLLLSVTYTFFFFFLGNVTYTGRFDSIELILYKIFIRGVNFCFAHA